MYRRILVPIDGSDPACHGLSEAVRLAKAWGSTLCLLHVVCVEPLAAGTGAPAEREGLRRSLRERAESLLRSAELTARSAGVAVETQVREVTEGRPGCAILDEAASGRCDLIVMGTHGRSGLGHAVIGTNAEEVVCKSPVPVLTLHPVKAPRRRATSSNFVRPPAAG